MIPSISTPPGLNVFLQTAGSFTSVLPGSLVSLPPSSSSDIMDRLQSQQQSAASATDALRNLHSSLQDSMSAFEQLERDGTDEAALEKLRDLREGLLEVNTGLEEIRAEIGDARVDHQIYDAVSGRVTDALNVVERALGGDHTRARVEAEQTLRQTLASLGTTERLSQNLYRAGIQVLKINSSYGVPAAALGPTGLEVLYGASTTAAIGQPLGAAFDAVS